MTTLPFGGFLADPPVPLRLRDLADRLLKSCRRKPIDVQRWHEWKRGKRDLSIEMIRNAIAAGGNRGHARAVLLQLLSDLSDAEDAVPAIEEILRLLVEIDGRGDRVRQLALLDGRIDAHEKRELEITLTEEVGVINLLLERLRRSPDYLTLRIG